MKPPEIYQFGEFVVDPSRRALLRGGEPVFLPTKAYEVLLVMVQNPGRVLTRDEILRTVWPDTVVEEGNLSQNIFLVRKALNESAGEQRLVLTVFGSGYQFAAQVERRSLPGRRVEDFPAADSYMRAAEERSGPRLIASALPVDEPEPIPVNEAEPLLEQASEHRPALVMPSPRFPGRGHDRYWYAGAALAMLLAAGGVFAWQHFRAVPPANIHLLIAELDNTTGDPTFDHALNKALQIDLQQSPSLALYGAGRVRATMKLMQLDPAAKVTPEVAREACERMNGQAVLEPMIASFGGHYLLTLTARACSDGRILGDRKQEALDKAGILTALDTLADGIRHDIGESSASIRRFDRPLYAAETASLDALKAYTEGGRFANSGQFPQAIALLQRAIELDPKFAIAYADLSGVYYNLADRQHDKDAITRAYQLRDTVSDWERFYIEYRYHQSVTGDLNKSIAVMQQDAAIYPHDGSTAGNLSNAENWIGNYTQAVKYADRAMEIDRTEQIYNANGFEIAARSYKHANQFDRALQIGDEALKRGPSAGMVGILVQIATIRRDDAKVEQLIAISRGTANEPHVLQEAAAAALYEGRAGRTAELFRQAHVAAARENSTDDMLDLDATQARMLVEVGLPDQAVAAIAALPKMDEAMDAVYAMAEVGDAAKAQAIAQQRLQAEPNDQMLTAEYAPAVRAAVAMRKGKPRDAIAAMAGDAAYELRDPTVPYLLGQAYLAAGEPREAVAEFRKFLDNPGIDDPLTPLYALCILGTARGLAAQGDVQGAAGNYRKFFDFWKNADSDLPVLTEARAEYTKLAATNAR